MGYINLEVGETFTFAKTFTETDAYLFAGISGDNYALHINEEYAKKTPYGRRLVHGCLTFSLASTVSGYAAAKGRENAASLCYNNLRFLRPVFHGDTITATYTIVKKDEERMRTEATCVMTNQRGETVITCEHILKFFE
ncbi:MAG: MaoC family dehydratase [Oscillospiraceae bacterium]|nr:MaoC family dehydratase [Oscillospiraceae bacterium]